MVENQMENAAEDQKQVFVSSLQELRGWLEEHHRTSGSVWLVRTKKGFAKEYIPYDDLVDELMCFGWVDSLPRNLDEERTMLRISPRNPKSNWSRINKERVERLTAAGRMQAAGLEMVSLARKNGRWTFLDEVEDLIIPADLQLALAKNAQAAYYFDRFPDSSKRGILEWIKNARQASTRDKRIEDTVEKASRNIKANHPKGRDAGPKDNQDKAHQ